MSQKLFPTLALAMSLAAAPHATQADQPERTSIVDVALAINADTVSPMDPDGEFATLIAAVLAADPAVLAKLSGNGKVTVFAPTDAAFAALGLDASSVVTLPQEALTSILLYHVASGERDSVKVVGSDRIRTLAKQFLFVDVAGDDVFLVDNDADSHDARILVLDVEADNGLIHVIDNVLLP